MKKYIITGVNGFVGQYFIEHLNLVEPDADVFGLGIEGQTNINKIKYKSVDLCNSVSVNNIIMEYKPDYIVHLAAVSSVAKSWDNPAECFLHNNATFLNLAEAIRKNCLSTRILSVGSSEEYGVYNKPITETDGLHPKNPYSVARVSQEYLSKLYVDKFGLDIVMTRSFNHIGPRQSSKFVVSSFVEQLVNIADGKSENKMMVGNIDVVRDFTDVRDVVDAYYSIVTKSPNRETYNVCSGKGTVLREVINIISKQLNITPKIIVDESRLRSNEIMSVVGDNTKIKTNLGWQPKYDLEKTIADMISYKRSGR